MRAALVAALYVLQSIETLTAAALDRHRADVWLLSPPCQPFTSNGKRRDDTDNRSAAFLHLLRLLPSLREHAAVVASLVGPHRSCTYCALAA
eukprot:COSAG01_NODE_584_length_15174_cov_27.387901_22_plen_92_part_00